MASYPTDLPNSVLVSNNDQADELRNVEAAANKALQNIQSLYNEIMTPKPYADFETESLSETEFSDPPVSNTRSRHLSCNYKAHTNSRRELRKCYNNNTNANTAFVSNQQTPSIPSDNNSLNIELNNACKIYLTPNEKLKVTVPKPFSLTAENIKRQQARELKLSKLREEIDKETEKELNVKFSCKPVPKHVNLPLYGEMVARSQKRKVERKEKCHEILEKVKPFELSYMKSGLSKSQSVGNLTKEDTYFKAKPLPKSILNENISKKLKDKEEIRKILIAQRAEEMLKKSSSPFTPKCIPYSYSMYNTSKEKKDQAKLSKADIDAITRRLYTIKCKEAMEDWNNKVLQNDLWNHKTCNSKNKSTKKEDTCHQKSKVQFENTLPFYNFPVRMSNAAVLRDKQIRTEILQRERREETDKVIREETEKKKKGFIKNIWPRLKSVETTINFERDIEEKVKSFRASQKNREQEYIKELEEMMERVSKQFLLIERQGKEPKSNPESSGENESSEKVSSEKQEVDDTASDLSDEYTDKVESSSLQPSDD